MSLALKDPDKKKLWKHEIVSTSVNHQESTSLENYLCTERALNGKDQACLNIKGDTVKKVTGKSKKGKKSKKSELWNGELICKNSSNR